MITPGEFGIGDRTLVTNEFFLRINTPDHPAQPTKRRRICWTDKVQNDRDAFSSKCGTCLGHMPLVFIHVHN